MNIAEKDTAEPNMLAETSETLLEAERLHSLGQAASAIAHDIDVAMAPITLYTEAMLEHETLSDRARHYLSSIRRAVDDVTHNVARLRELDRPREELQRTDPQNSPSVRLHAQPARAADRRRPVVDRGLAQLARPTKATR